MIDLTMSITKFTVFSNLYRTGIIYLLKNSPNNEMQAETIAKTLGITHRTVLYHLDVLEKSGLIRVRRYRIRGNKLFRSIWGLNQRNGRMLQVFFSEMEDNVDKQELVSVVTRNIARR